MIQLLHAIHQCKFFAKAAIAATSTTLRFPIAAGNGQEWLCTIPKIKNYTLIFLSYLCINTMNTITKIIFVAFGLFCGAFMDVAWGQTNHTQAPLSPYGVLDTVFDRFGNKYGMRDIMIDTISRHQSDGRFAPNNQMLCTSSGYFNLWFENGSGFQNNQLAVNDLCQMFSDLSQFVQRPSGGEPINIWIRDPRNLNIPPAIANTWGGLAISFYNLPTRRPSTFSGIAENEMWKSINSGTNSYSSTVLPLSQSGGSANITSGAIAHAIIAFRFTGGISWHYSPQPPNNNAADFYTVALHEFTHCLGFGTLMERTGKSIFDGFGLKYYARYDRFLEKKIIVNY